MIRRIRVAVGRRRFWCAMCQVTWLDEAESPDPCWNCEDTAYVVPYHHDSEPVKP